VRDGDVREALEAVRIHHTSTLRALGIAAEPNSPFGDDASR
jgi:hypothetical protein